MSVKAELKQVKSLVLKALTDYPETRSSDDLLYMQVCHSINPAATYAPFGRVLSLRRTYGIPAFESVRRTRQKLQAEMPELAACAEVDAERCIREEEYREYARS